MDKSQNYGISFDKKHYYSGDDLGASWSPVGTAFRVWAPTAWAVSVVLYPTGDGSESMQTLDMAPDVCGTWFVSVPGDLEGVYYTYRIRDAFGSREACDPYARTTGINGARAMVCDLRATDPQDWDKDTCPHRGKPITDAVLYELHLRDISADPASGITHKGKFLGLAESGTRNSKGQPTGLDHICSLGVTHVHLLPVFDFGSVDEDREDAYNWGYDPVNFNVPDGSYATDPRDGHVRIREFKQLIKALHDRGLGVVMDVVYNHVYSAGDFCFNRLVPGYFSRRENGKYSNGSGCGNDTATERLMVQKYIADSVTYWAREYHIDGFRFDLMGLMDTQTMNRIAQQLPQTLLYGEGWSIPTGVTRQGVTLATQENSGEVPAYSFFSDTIRDGLRGSVFRAEDPGFVAGKEESLNSVKNCWLGRPGWCKDPRQAVNYVSCHDNLTLFDKLRLSSPDRNQTDWIRMNKLAAAVYMTAQGVPFFQAGEELLKTKVLADGSVCENSYRAGDRVNAIRWDTLKEPTYADVLEYYRGLIALRRSCSLFRLQTRQQVDAHIRDLSVEGLAAFLLTGEREQLFVIFNCQNHYITRNLPGKWEVLVNEKQAGTEPLTMICDQVMVSPVSALILRKKG